MGKPKGISRMQMLMVSLKLLQRLLDLRYGMTVKEMADELGTTKRTAYRYLDAFKQVGIELEIYQGTDERAKRWRIPLSKRRKLSALLQTA